MLSKPMLVIITLWPLISRERPMSGECKDYLIKKKDISDRRIADILTERNKTTRNVKAY
jgi:hypothetical protein